MFTIFKGTLNVLIRRKELFVWALAFPILLSTMFIFMFSNLDDATSFKPVATGIVSDSNYESATMFASTMETLGEQGSDQLLDIHKYRSFEEAQDALQAGSVIGVVSVDQAGEPHLALAATSDGVGADQIDRSILDTVLNTYLRNAALLSSIAAENPLALANPQAVEEALSHGSATEQVSLTHSSPTPSVRFYYALLGMAALFCAQIGLTAITEAQPNLSALGARRSVGAISRGKTLLVTLVSSWLVAFCCLLATFAYIRFVAGVDFGGREGLCVGALAIAALFAISFGTFLGALPKIKLMVKVGILTASTCLLSLFAGLYGEPAMELADSISRAFPLTASLNPAKVITDTFYSLYYYDSLEPFLGKVGLLLLMTTVLFALSSLFVRRQRYASI